MTTLHRRPRAAINDNLKVVPGLGCASPSDLEPLLRIADLERLLGCDRRSIERMRSAGRFPAPDLHIGRMPRWRRQAIEDWISRGGRR